MGFARVDEGRARRGGTRMTGAPPSYALSGDRSAPSPRGGGKGSDVASTSANLSANGALAPAPRGCRARGSAVRGPTDRRLTPMPRRPSPLSTDSLGNKRFGRFLPIGFWTDGRAEGDRRTNAAPSLARMSVIFLLGVQPAGELSGSGRLRPSWSAG